VLYLAAESYDDMDKWMKEIKSGKTVLISICRHFNKGTRRYFRTLRLVPSLKSE